MSQRATYPTAVVAACLAVACLTGCHESMVVLQPPAGRSAVQIDDDIDEAFAGARAGVPEHITSEDLASLGGRNTRGFVSRGHPAVHYKTLYPACGKSLLNFAPRSLTDRYVLLLLRKGYWWSVIP